MHPDPVSGQGAGFIGLISDTHGLLRPEALAALEGSRVILHAGDVGDPDILAALERVAPVRAVYGNTDRGPLRRRLSETEAVPLGEGVDAYLIHILDDLDLDPAAAGFQVVVYGHTHVPLVERRDGVCYVNPGSAGPRRFSLPVTVARITLEEGVPVPEIVRLAG